MPRSSHQTSSGSVVGRVGGWTHRPSLPRDQTKRADRWPPLGPWPAASPTCQLSTSNQSPQPHTTAIPIRSPQTAVSSSRCQLRFASGVWHPRRESPNQTHRPYKDTFPFPVALLCPARALLPRSLPTSLSAGAPPLRGGVTPWMGDLGGGDWREAVAEKGLAEADGGPDHLVIMVHGIVGRFGRFLCLADFPSI